MPRFQSLASLRTNPSTLPRLPTCFGAGHVHCESMLVRGYVLTLGHARGLAWFHGLGAQLAEPARFASLRGGPFALGVGQLVGRRQGLLGAFAFPLAGAVASHAFDGRVEVDLPLAVPAPLACTGKEVRTLLVLTRIDYNFPASLPYPTRAPSQQTLDLPTPL